MKSLFCALALAMIALKAVWAAEDEAYIDVEIKGTLETGIKAIGGETTGTIIRVGKVTWELDFGGNKDLQEQAEKLSKQQVLVTGRYQQKQGVEVRVRHIVTVKTLKGTKEK